MQRPKPPKKSETLEVRLRLAAGGAAALALAAAAAPSIARTDLRADFRQIDRDGDGRVRLEELSAASEVKVGRARAVAFPDPRREADQARLRTLVVQALFQRLDADRDGAVTFTEYGRLLAPVAPSGSISARSAA
jgi:hypothetical protein